MRSHRHRTCATEFGAGLSPPCMPPCRFRASCVPAWAQRFKTFANADSFSEHLSRHGRRVIVKGIQDAEFEAIHPKLIREVVVELLLRDRSLGHAETAKRSRRYKMRVDCTSERAIMRHAVRAGAMYRNAGRDRRSPRIVGSAVEVAGETHADQLAVFASPGARVNARWMPLGRAHDGLDP